MSLDEILKKIKLDKITSESTGYSDMLDGYYLSEVEEVKFSLSKSTGNEMISWRLVVVEKGIQFDENNVPSYIEDSKKRKIFMYSVMKDEKSIERSLSDLLKFEDNEGTPLLSPEYFTSKEVMTAAFELLIGKRIYISLKTDEKGNQWKHFVSWKGAEKLGLTT